MSADNESIILDGKTAIVVAPDEDGPTHQAAQVLAGDIEAITGQRPTVRPGAPEENERCIFIASAGNAKAAEALRALNVDTSAIAGRWEAYLFHTAGQTIVICGADDLATMRGVYGFTRLALEVDPLHHWTQLAPETRKRIELSDVDRVVDTPTFQFRGWFLNAGHLIHWNLGHGPVEDVMAKYGRLTGQAGISGAFGPEMADMVIEAALRSDMNLLIPLSYLNLDDDTERVVADRCRDWGIYLSHHHQEPVGANLRLWDEFWLARGDDVPDMSFYRNPDAFETWWRYWVSRWAEYPRTLWVIGHRGPNDRPFWLMDEHCPETMEARGKVISDAMQMQVRLIREAFPDEPVHFCATLWQEGSPLHDAGVLHFPPKTIVVMADHGSKQLMREDFYRIQRRDELRYGVYYHVCYGPGGPIWAQGNSPDRMWYAMREVIEQGDTALALLNVGNIRPYFPGLACWSRLTTEPAGFDPERWLRDWCIEKYGLEHADEIVEAYNAFFYAYITPYYPLYDGHRGLWEGVLVNETWRFCQLLYDGDPESAYKRLNRPFADAWTFAQFHRNKTAAMRGSWDAVCAQAHELTEKLQGPARDLLEDNLAVQAELVRGLTRGTHQAAAAVLAVLNDNRDAAVQHLSNACEAVQAAWKYCRENGNRGVYAGWFAGEEITDVRVLRMLDGARAALAGEMPDGQERQWLDQRLALPVQS